MHLTSHAPLILVWMSCTYNDFQYHIGTVLHISCILKTVPNLSRDHKPYFRDFHFSKGQLHDIDFMTLCQNSCEQADVRQNHAGWSR